MVPVEFGAPHSFDIFLLMCDIGLLDVKSIVHVLRWARLASPGALVGYALRRIGGGPAFLRVNAPPHSIWIVAA